MEELWAKPQVTIRTSDDNNGHGTSGPSGPNGAERPIFNGDRKIEILEVKYQRERQNMITNPLEVPKRTLLWCLYSSLRSRVAQATTIMVTALSPNGPKGPKRSQTVPNGPKRSQTGVPYKKTKLSSVIVQKRRNMVQIPFAGVHSSTFPSV